MPFQHHNTQPQDPPRSATIRFHLVGRTTLSEHLPSETIDVPLNTILQSRHLTQLAKTHSSHLHPNTPIHVSNIDPAGFRLYIEYLHTRRITFPSRSSTRTTGLLLRDCIDHLYAHIVGSRLGDTVFQNHVIDEIDARLDPAQSLDAQVFEVVFVEKGAPEALKRFVVDRMCAMDRWMLEMLRGAGSGGREEEGRCGYHVHGEGEGCRGTGRWDSGGGGERVVWEVDEDGEVREMAAHYLGGANARSMIEADNLAVRSLSARNSGGSCPSRTTTLSQNSKATPVDIYTPDTHYFSSTAWFRDGHLTNTPMHQSTPFTHLDKPLPPIPQVDSCSSSPIQTHLQHERLMSTQDFLNRDSASTSEASIRDLRPLVPRKPAPPRGLDWLEQWERLNELHGMHGFGFRKSVRSAR